LRRTAVVLNIIVEAAIYFLVFIIPFSKAGIEIFATTAIIGWVLVRLIGRFLSRKNNEKKKSSLLPQTPLNGPIFLLFAIYLVSMAFSADMALSLEGVFLKLAEYILIFFICADIFSKDEHSHIRLRILSGVILGALLLLYADAGFQWVKGEDFIRGFSGGRRLRASFHSSSDFAGYLIAFLPVLFCICFAGLKKIPVLLKAATRAVFALLFIAGLILLCKTFTRGAWLAYFVSMVLMAVLGFCARPRKKSFIIAAILAVIIPFAAAFTVARPAGERLMSIQRGFGASATRLYQWREASAVIGDFPLLGSGPNTYSKISHSYKITGKTGFYPHNSYLHIAAEVGILGLLAFLWVLWSFFREGIKALLASCKERYLIIGIMAGVSATLVQSIFDTNLFALRLIVLFWIMLGIGTARIIKAQRV